MAMTLVRVRRCDGVCCVQAPRFPNADHSDCVFHKTGVGKESSGCMLMTGEAEVPEGRCPVIDMSARRAFQETCVDWPQNAELCLGETGGCCLQVVDDGD